MTSQLNGWVFLCDWKNDAEGVCKTQIDLVQKEGISFEKVISCNENTPQPAVCDKLQYFPAFCEMETGKCVYGRRETRDAILTLKNDEASK